LRRFKTPLQIDERKMNAPIKAGSGSRPYKRDCAYCLLQGTTNEPPSPAPRKAAIIGKPVLRNEALAFLFLRFRPVNHAVGR
jgi:hypothetical protein